MVRRNNKIILGLALVFLLGVVGPVAGQTTKTFTGKISEIAKGSELDIAKHGDFLYLATGGTTQNQLSPFSRRCG